MKFLDKDYEVKPGTYSALETVPAGWDKTGNTCIDVVVDPGETEYCEITNVKKGKITIVKDADPNDCQDFAYTGGLGSFSLDDDQGVVECGGTNQPQSKTSILVANNNYTVTEAIPNQYWKLKSITCTEGATVNVNLLTGSVTITLDPGEEVTCTFLNEKLSPTRTQGFWQTHTTYTSSIFQTYFGTTGMKIGDGTTHKAYITNVQSTGASQLFGGFYASIPKTSTGVKRSDIDKARMQLLQQLIAAKLNCAIFGCSLAVQTMIANADSVYASGPASAIITAAGQLDGYNNSGDTLIIGNAGKATPKTSQSWANIPFWNLP